MDQPPQGAQGRKLAIAAGSVAAFVGFMGLTSWTSSGEGSEQDDQDMAAFCYVVSSTETYATVLQLASASGGFGGGNTGVESQSAEILADALVERAPDEFLTQADRAVEGIDRALQGDLDPFEAEEYIADFEQLEADTRDDCEPYAGEGGGLVIPGGEGEGVIEQDGGGSGFGGNSNSDSSGGFGGGG
jgi:hypothetical protein